MSKETYRQKAERHHEEFDAWLKENSGTGRKAIQYLKDIAQKNSENRDLFGNKYDSHFSIDLGARNPDGAWESHSMEKYMFDESSKKSVLGLRFGYQEVGDWIERVSDRKRIEYKSLEKDPDYPIVPRLLLNAKGNVSFDEPWREGIGQGYRHITQEGIMIKQFQIRERYKGKRTFAHVYLKHVGDIVSHVGGIDAFKKKVGGILGQ